MGIDPSTGDFRMLADPSDLMPNEVLVQGTEDEIKRLSRGIKALNADEKRKAKRKAQRASRKRNR